MSEVARAELRARDELRAGARLRASLEGATCHDLASGAHSVHWGTIPAEFISHGTQKNPRPHKKKPLHRPLMKIKRSRRRKININKQTNRGAAR